MHIKVHQKICRNTFQALVNQTTRHPLTSLERKENTEECRKPGPSIEKCLVSFFDRSLLLSTSDTSLKAHQSPQN